MKLEKQIDSELPAMQFNAIIDWLVFNRRCITYKALACALGIAVESISCRKWMLEIMPMLERLDYEDRLSGAPRRSALIITKSYRLPGKGFWGDSQSCLGQHRNILYDVYRQKALSPRLFPGQHECLHALSIDVMRNVPELKPIVPAVTRPVPEQVRRAPSKSADSVLIRA